MSICICAHPTQTPCSATFWAKHKEILNGIRDQEQAYHRNITYRTRLLVLPECNHGSWPMNLFFRVKSQCSRLKRNLSNGRKRSQCKARTRRAKPHSVTLWSSGKTALNSSECVWRCGWCARAPITCFLRSVSLQYHRRRTCQRLASPTICPYLPSTRSTTTLHHIHLSYVSLSDKFRPLCPKTGAFLIRPSLQSRCFW